MSRRALLGLACAWGVLGCPADERRGGVSQPEAADDAGPDVPEAGTDGAAALDAEQDVGPPPPPPVDTEPPQWRPFAHLAVGNIMHHQIGVDWRVIPPYYDYFQEAAYDNIAVTAYAVELNGERIAVVSAEIFSHMATGLEPDTTYRFQVQAGDGAGNWTTDGPTTEAKTECASFLEDKCPPWWPPGATLEATLDGEWLRFSWTPAEDNRKILGYQLLQDGECLCVHPDPGGVTVVGDQLEYTMPVPPLGTYHYQVAARDFSGGWTAGPEAEVVIE